MACTSIIIVSYNSRSDLVRCLDSVVATTDAEVILVDNASTDGSADHVEAHFPQVRVLRQRRNLGFAAANNVGAAQARGDMLVFLNPDTIVTAGWLDGLRAAAETEPASLVSPKILFIDYTPPTIYTCGNHVSFSGLTFCRGWGQRADRFVDTETVPAISGTCFAVKRSVFDALGGFDDLFFLYVEDTDLSWRARLAGLECRCAPESVIYHQYELRFTPQKSYYLERNRYLLLLKNLAPATLIAMLPMLLCAEIVVWVYLALRGPRHVWAKVRSYVWLITHRRQIADARRQAQALRQVSDRDVLRAFSPTLLFAQTAPAPVARLLDSVTRPVFTLVGRLPIRVSGT